MPEDTREAAKRRAIFARTERLKREQGEAARKDADGKKIEQRKVDTERAKFRTAFVRDPTSARSAAYRRKRDRTVPVAA